LVLLALSFRQQPSPVQQLACVLHQMAILLLPLVAVLLVVAFHDPL
jgi:hypothetical protein